MSALPRRALKRKSRGGIGRVRSLDPVVLNRDLPECGLCRGELGAIVQVHSEGEFAVELVLASGKTQALVSLDASDLRAVGDGDLLTLRTMTTRLS